MSASQNEAASKLTLLFMTPSSPSLSCEPPPTAVGQAARCKWSLSVVCVEGILIHTKVQHNSGPNLCERLRGPVCRWRWHGVMARTATMCLLHRTELAWDAQLRRLQHVYPRRSFSRGTGDCNVLIPHPFVFFFVKRRNRCCQSGKQPEPGYKVRRFGRVAGAGCGGTPS